MTREAMDKCLEQALCKQLRYLLEGSRMVRHRQTFLQYKATVLCRQRLSHSLQCPAIDSVPSLRDQARLVSEAMVL